MLSQEENELITRIGPGTPMGNAMRRYWIPACLSSEIGEPDGAPVRVKLLGEDLVAFRDTEGRIGLRRGVLPASPRVALFRAQRGVRPALRLSRLEVRRDRRLRRHDERARGTCSSSTRSALAAYPTCELGGIVWAYLGPAEMHAAAAEFAWTQVPETHRHVTKVIQECNWLQALEGGIDTSHAPILHRLLTDNSTRGGLKPSNPFVRGKAPNLRVDITDYGYRYAGRSAARRRRTSTCGPITSSCRSTRSARRDRRRGLPTGGRPYLGADR